MITKGTVTKGTDHVDGAVGERVFGVQPAPATHNQSSTHDRINMAQHLDASCVLLSDPSTFGAGGTNQNTPRLQIL